MKIPGQISDYVLHKDNQVIALNKPAGLAVQPDKTKDADLLSLASAYIRHDLYLIHRLDRPVSGVLLMGQKPGAQTALTEQFKAGMVEKTYLAVVGVRPEQDEDTLVHYIESARGNRSIVHDEEQPGAKRAELSYRYLASSDRYHLLEVNLKTGRKHQIRAQLAAIGSPVRGDKKYGFKRSNPGGTVDLHSYRIAYNHPVTGARTSHEAPLPDTPVWGAFAGVVV